jgi:hypothetical protein
MSGRLTTRSLVCAFLLWSMACADRAPVHVRAFYQSGVPLSGLEVSAIPFDPNRLLDSLSRHAPTPKPDFGELETRLKNYRRRDTVGAVESVSAGWLAIKDSVVRMARELSRQDRRASGYREAYGRFRQLYARYSAKEAEREARQRNLFPTDRALAAEATRASDSLRAWETAAYRPFPALADERVARSGRPADRAHTDSVGAVRLELPNGEWWVTAKAPDPDNPFQELYWNVPVRITAALPLGVPLMRANATLRWRH